MKRQHFTKSITFDPATDYLSKGRKSLKIGVNKGEITNISQMTTENEKKPTDVTD